ncbi:hypothetical protein NTH44_003176 [Vibrio metoecus]
MASFYVEVSLVDGELIRHISYVVLADNYELAAQAAICSESYSADMDWSGEYVRDLENKHLYRACATELSDVEAAIMRKHVKTIQAQPNKLYASGNYRTQKIIKAVVPNSK